MKQPDPAPTPASTPIEWAASAMAAWLQSASLVGRLARTGLIPQDSYETCLGSLFVFDAEQVAEVYRGHRGLTHGFRILEELSQGRGVLDHRETLRYAWQVQRIARELARRTEMRDRLRQGLQRIGAEGVDSHGDEWVAAEISKLYQRTISTLPQRVQVIGDIRYLQHPYTAYRVRALLLAAVRAATLWQQVAGGWWNAVLQRRLLLDHSRRYLNTH